MKTAVITGASSGIGLAAAAELAQKGYFIIGVGRDQTRCDAAEKEIQNRAPGAKVTFICGDLLQQREVLRVAQEIAELLARENGGRLEALINNAGCVRSWYTTTEEGYEQQFALNHLAGFLLTYRLLPQLRRAEGKVIMTGSESHKNMRMHWKNVMLTHRYNPLTAYKQTKLANILFAKGLNDRYLGDGIRAYVVDPGLVCTDIGCKSTGGLVSWIWNLRKKHGVSPEIPAKTYAYLCETKPAPRELYYAASKRFLLDIAVALREELRNQHVNVLALCPGGLATTKEAMRGIAAQGFWGSATTNPMEIVSNKTISRLLRRGGIYIPGALNRTLNTLGKLIPRRWVAAAIYHRWRKAQRQWNPGEFSAECSAAVRTVNDTFVNG